MPPAPCALVLCRSSLELETNSKRALLWGEGGWGLMSPSVHWPQHPTLRLLGRDPPRAHLRKGTKLASGSCIHESETLLGKPSPNAFLPRKAALSALSPRSLLALGPRRVWGASCSLGTGAVLVVAGARNQLKTCSLLGRRRMGHERPCVNWPQQSTFRQLGRDPARAHLRKGTKLASGSYICESETLLRKPSSAPMRVVQESSAFWFLP